MADNLKIKAPNFTMIPNVIFDYWMKVLENLEFKILLCICRKTLGWHKDKDSLSMNQIADLTNSSKDGVRKCLKKLESYGLIKRYVSKNSYGDNNPNVYELHIYEDSEEIKEINDYSLGKTDSVAQVGDSVVQGVGDSVVHPRDSVAPQKKLFLNKEEINRERDSSSPELFKYTSLESDQQRVVMPMNRYNKLVDKYGKDIIDTYMERLDRYADTSPDKFKKYKSHAATIAGWIERDGVIPVSRAKKESPPESCAAPPLNRKPRSVEEVNLKSCRHAEKLGLFSGKKFKNCGHYLINLDNKKDVVFQMLPEAFVNILNDIFEFRLEDPKILMRDFDES